MERSELAVVQEPQEMELVSSTGVPEVSEGLIQRLSAFYAPEKPFVWEDPEPEDRLRVLPDGYVRRTPYQPRHTPMGYGEVRRRRSIGYAGVTLFIILLVMALIRAGFLRF